MEIETLNCLVDPKREKDVFVTRKRSSLEREPVEVERIAEPTDKKAKVEDAIKEEEGEEGWEEEDEEEEEEYFLNFGDSIVIRRYVHNYRNACHHLDQPTCISKKRNPFYDKKERAKINQVIWNQEEEEDEDMWPTDSEKWEEEVNQNVRKGKISFSSQSKSWNLVACKSSKEDQPSNTGMTIFSGKLNRKDEENIWHPHLSSTSDDDYERLFALRLKRIEEFCEHLLKRPDIKDGYIDEQVFLDKLHEESPMPKSLAEQLIKLALVYHFNLPRITQLFRCLEKLLSLVPFITGTTDYQSKYFIKSCIVCGISEKDIDRARFHLKKMFHMEPFFHPFIRKNNIKDIVALHEILAKIEWRQGIQKIKDNGHFSSEAITKVVPEQISSEAYRDAFKTVELHQFFDRYLVFRDDDLPNRKIKELMRDDNVVPSRFKILDDFLIKASLRMRIMYLKKLDEFKRYIAWLEPFVELKAKEGYTRLDGILKAVGRVHPDFPQLSQECILDEKSEQFSNFCDLLSEIKRFTKCPVSLSYCLEGILFYLDICCKLEKEEELRDRIDVYDAFKKDCEY